MKKHNFSAGPAILPASVIEQSARAVQDLNGIGLSVMEISHRSEEFVAILGEAIDLVRQILSLPEEYEVLFLTGGASSQFFMTAMNMLNENELACFVDTGSWSSKASKEAKLFGKVEVIASSKDRNYTYIPKEFVIPERAKYLHITSNNTIYGTQYHDLPQTETPFVCDMSSDIFSRPIDIDRFDFIYAGAQKNTGPAGVTLVIVRKGALGKVKRQIPTMLDYRTHINKNSAFNTPPVFPIYVSMLTLRWIRDVVGGLEVMAVRNARKANIMYEEIDRNSCFAGVAETEDRSLMNATFVLENPELEVAFLKLCDEAGCVGVKGHRSAGGFRASIYNAMPVESVEVLVEVMKAFEEIYG